MSENPIAQYHVAVIGAGPAGLFAARELALSGVRVALLNRDIKPGGLAEYGIYPSKLRMKEGLRNQFRQIIALENIDYYGNVLVGLKADISLDDLRAMGFHALLVTVGAQSVKRLGLPGEDLSGVYHAKDIVYHYNLLPPYSESTFQIGKRVAVIGVGNVMVDIARWLLEDKQVDEVTAVARRGPAEVKFDRKELESIVSYVDLPALDAELRRVSPTMRALGQDPRELKRTILEISKKAPPAKGDSCFRLHFLSSPVRILDDGFGRVSGLELEENNLLLDADGQVRVVPSGQLHRLNADTVIFAIGDVVDGAIGLPVQNGEYVKNPQPRFPVEGVTYEVFDPLRNEVVPDVFLGGWARRPSAGLVGVARRDAINAAHAVLPYLETMQPDRTPVCDHLRAWLLGLDHPVVDKHDLQRLELLERERARELNLETYKFRSNQEMLSALGLVKTPD